MALLHEYHRPATLDEALKLLQRSESPLRPLAGGTELVGLLETGALPAVDGVVDLQDLGLRYVRQDSSGEADLLRIGALATLTDVCENETGKEVANGLLRRSARGEGPLNLRNAATVGGIVASAVYDSEFYAALLALETTVTLYGGETEQTVSLSDRETISRLLQTGLIIEVQIPVRELRGGHARVSRTPSDRPIVAAVAVTNGDGVRVALCGVDETPVLVITDLHPPDDFKGSAKYRRAMADIVTERALVEVDNNRA